MIFLKESLRPKASLPCSDLSPGSLRVGDKDGLWAPPAAGIGGRSRANAGLSRQHPVVRPADTHWAPALWPAWGPARGHPVMGATGNRGAGGRSEGFSGSGCRFCSDSVLGDTAPRRERGSEGQQGDVVAQEATGAGMVEVEAWGLRCLGIEGSWAGVNGGPRTRGLSAMDLRSLNSGTRGLKSRCQQGRAPSRVSGGDSAPHVSSFQELRSP